MGVFCDRLKFGSTAALNCRTSQNKGRYCKKELLLLLILLRVSESKKQFLVFLLLFKMNYQNTNGILLGTFIRQQRNPLSSVGFALTTGWRKILSA